MPIPSGLNRLLQLRAIEEQYSRAQLASVNSELHKLEAALEVAQGRQKGGRALVRNSIGSGEVQGRYIGLEEISCGSAGAQILKFRIKQMSARVAELQADLVRKHREAKQVEALIQTALERETAAWHRRLQLQLDEWARLHWSGEDSNSRASACTLQARTTTETISEPMSVSNSGIE